MPPSRATSTGPAAAGTKVPSTKTAVTASALYVARRTISASAISLDLAARGYPRPAMRWRLLEGLPDEEVRRVLAVARRRRFARNEVVFHRGDPADTIHLISKGRFAIRIVTPLGDTAILAVLGPGELFGELALVSSEAQRSATVVALEPAETMSVHRVDFEGLRARHPSTADVVVCVLAGQVRRLSEHLVEALYVPADRRVLRRLLEVAGVYGENGREVSIPLTQEDIAGLAGTSRATVNKVLRDAEGRGEVRLERGRTVVLDVDAIGRRAGRGPTGGI
jgi:CRP/FNR family transcriptional regulator, cyclic AMP receptor protein